MKKINLKINQNKFKNHIKTKQNTNNKNSKGLTIADPMDIKRKIREYFEKLYAN